MDCLVFKFIEEFGCIHARLVHYYDKIETNTTKICAYDDLVGHLSDHDPYTDPGLVKLREFYNAFDDSADSDKYRCGCSKPCRETRFKIESFKTEEITERRLKLDSHKYEVESFGLFMVSKLYILLVIVVNLNFNISLSSF